MPARFRTRRMAIRSKEHGILRIKTILWGFLLLPFLLANPFAAIAQGRVALLLEHEQASIWTNLLRQGLEQAQKDFGVETQVIIAPANEDQTKIFREAAANFDLVLVTGESLHNILRDNASNFRRVKFGSIDAGIRASNIMSVTFADQEAAFLAGVAAAMLTKDTSVPGINPKNVIGWLSGMDTPALATLYNGFQEGAKLVNPAIKIAQGLVNSFTDGATATKKAESLINRGADVIVLAAGAGNTDALASLVKHSAWHIDLDAPSHTANTLGAICKDAAKAVYEIVQSWASGDFQAKQILVYNLGNKGVAYEDNSPKQGGSPVFANIARRIRELRSELIKDAIHVKSLRTRTLCDCLD